MDEVGRSCLAGRESVVRRGQSSRWCCGPGWTRGPATQTTIESVVRRGQSSRWCCRLGWTRGPATQTTIESVVRRGQSSRWCCRLGWTRGPATQTTIKHTSYQIIIFFFIKVLLRFIYYYYYYVLYFLTLELDNFILAPSSFGACSGPTFKKLVSSFFHYQFDQPLP